MSKPTDAEYNTALARLAPSTLRRSICGGDEDACD